MIPAPGNDVEFEFTLEGALPPAAELNFITATATLTGTGDTSEFSECREVDHPFFFDDFQNGPAPQWSRPETFTTPSGQKGLGRFGNDPVSLRLTRLPAHSRITISFDLYILQSWDGNHPENPDDHQDPPEFGPLGPDRWSLSVQGGPTLLDTTFSNHFGGVVHPPSDRQAYPGPFPGGDSSAGTGAAEINTLGYFHPVATDVPMDSVYRLTFTFNHTASSVVFRFSAFGLQGLADESWGLDNVLVVLSDIPVVQAAGAVEEALPVGGQRQSDLMEPAAVSVLLSEPSAPLTEPPGLPPTGRTAVPLDGSSVDWLFADSAAEADGFHLSPSSPKARRSDGDWLLDLVGMNAELDEAFPALLASATANG